MFLITTSVLVSQFYILTAKMQGTLEYSRLGYRVLVNIFRFLKITLENAEMMSVKTRQVGIFEGKNQDFWSAPV